MFLMIAKDAIFKANAYVVRKTMQIESQTFNLHDFFDKKKLTLL